MSLNEFKWLRNRNGSLIESVCLNLNFDSWTECSDQPRQFNESQWDFSKI